MKSLQSKIILVTGAERGIGRATALCLAEAGASVIVNYLSDTAAAEGVVEEIRSRGGEARAIQADIAEPLQISAMFQRIERLDCLVNNAGVGVPGGIDELRAEDIDTVFSVNVRGTALCTQAAVARMPKGGRIINISSSTVVYPLTGMSVYTASKAAVRAFTEVWARELGARGINVNSVLPGPTSPGMADLAPEEVKLSMAAASPYGRIGQAPEIADVIAFLCSHEARWVSGQHILVNGAATA